MREIKFRAWDKERKEMLPVKNMDFSQWWASCDPTYGQVQPSEYGERNSFKNENTDRHILMQYTGDKNCGYEGDILEWVEPIRGEHGDIMDYEHLRGVVEWDNERSGFILRCANGNEWLNELMNITIIGNIYESPELLHDPS